MNTTSYLLAGLTSAALTFSPFTSHAARDTALDTVKIRQQLSSVPNPELPAKAASLVLIDQSANRQKNTEVIVGAAVDLNPAAAAMIVSSVSKLSPDMAPTAASIAAAKQPKQTRAIAKAAAASAPSQALKIISAMCKNQPGDYRAIATSVADAVPRMDRSIIASVIEAVPTLKPFYTRTIKLFAQDKNITVAKFMDQISLDVETSAKALNMSPDTVLTAGIAPSQQSLLPTPPAPPTAPIVRPPFTSGGGHPGENNRDNSVPQTGPRIYSAP